MHKWDTVGTARILEGLLLEVLEHLQDAVGTIDVHAKQLCQANAHVIRKMYVPRAFAQRHAYICLQSDTYLWISNRRGRKRWRRNASSNTRSIPSRCGRILREHARPHANHIVECDELLDEYAKQQPAAASNNVSALHGAFDRKCLTQEYAADTWHTIPYTTKPYFRPAATCARTGRTQRVCAGAQTCRSCTSVQPAIDRAAVQIIRASTSNAGSD